MRLLKSRSFAWCVFAVVVIGAIWVSGGGALNAQREAVRSIFYHGVNGDGLCISRDLDVRAEVALNLASLARKYGIDEAMIKKAEEDAHAVANQKSDAIGERFSANRRLTTGIEDIYTEIENAGLSKPDGEFAYKQYKEFKSRADTISRDVYNQRAEEFNEALSRFPANVIAKAAFVAPLPLFGS